MPNAKSGFTLIELMVVIIILGVIAALAVPRFTNAVNKARIVEVPRVMALYENAYLIALVETAGVFAPEDLELFNVDDYNGSDWFVYTIHDGKYGDMADVLIAVSQRALGPFPSGGALVTRYRNEGPNVGTFTRHTDDVSLKALKKLHPVFANGFTVDVD